MTAASIETVGLVGAGAMGSALGANWRAGGLDVRTCVAGRSPRTVELVAAAGLTAVPTLDEVVGCDVVVSVVPPAQAVAVAGQVADAAGRAGTRPLFADLNAVAPSTMTAVRDLLAAAGLEVVDGSISGGPPTAERTTRVYLSGPLADRLASLPAPWLDVVRLSGPIGQASALKMCTASMYKGSTALVMQAMVTARAHGVLAEFLADTARAWPDNGDDWPGDVAVAASKSHRFVAEMREIARTQRGAGLTPAVFDGIADAYSDLSHTELADRSPEQADRSAPADAVVELIRPRQGARGVLFDFSGTLFHIETPEQALLAALGPDYLHLAPELRRYGGVNGSTAPEIVPPELEHLWSVRDLSLADHRAAYVGLSRCAGLTGEQADALYARGVSPDAWLPFRETVALLRELHARSVPVAMVSNIGWDPRPVLEQYGVLADLDALVLSYERGVQKPDPEIFRLACADLGLTPDAVVMVGDSEHADGGATALGIPFVLVPSDPAHRTGDELTRAVAVTTSRGA